MSMRLPSSRALLPVLGLVAFLSVGTPAGRARASYLDRQSVGGGSEVPCAVPLSWRVARVDRQFGVSVERASEIVRQATELWQGVAARPLFRHDPDGGFPIRFVYDERQERTQQRARRQVEIDGYSARIDSLGDDATRRATAHNSANERLASRLRDLERRVAEHNGVVRGWNERGGAPEDVKSQLEAVGVSLDAERDELMAVSRPLEAERRSIQEVEARIAREAAELERLATALTSDFPSAAVESGVYREAVRKEGERVVSVGREIRIFRFGTEDELRLVAAHELGHALGLGHTAAGVMSPSQEGGRGMRVPALNRVDEAALATTCPALVSLAPRPTAGVGSDAVAFTQGR